MIKFKLKRKISGEKIRKDRRLKEFHPEYVNLTQKHKFTCFKNTPPNELDSQRRTDGCIYNYNKPQKRYKDNPTFYEGEFMYAGTRQIRVPKKCRKGARKRFKKAFPQYKIDRFNKPNFDIEKFNELYKQKKIRSYCKKTIKVKLCQYLILK